MELGVDPRLLSSASRPALGPMQTCIQQVLGANHTGREAHHSAHSHGECTALSPLPIGFHYVVLNYAPAKLTFLHNLNSLYLIIMVT